MKTWVSLVTIFLLVFSSPVAIADKVVVIPMGGTDYPAQVNRTGQARCTYFDGADWHCGFLIGAAPIILFIAGIIYLHPDAKSELKRFSHTSGIELRQLGSEYLDASGRTNYWQSDETSIDR